MANTKREKLFTEFPPVPTEKWEEVITADLKGADYERKLVWRTGEGFNVRPYYRAENLEGIRFLGSQAGEFPYVRGTRSHNRWRVHQTVEVKCPREANAEALKLLNSGVDSLGFSIAKEGFTAEELDQLLAGISIPAIEMVFCGAQTGSIAELVIAKLEKEGTASEAHVAFSIDPLVKGLSQKGDFCSPNGEKCFAKIASLIEKTREYKHIRIVTVSAGIFSNAGSTIVEELAFALSAGNDYIARLTDAGVDAELAARKLRFSFSVTSNYFLEIAKFRAARMLWANIVKGYNPSKNCACKMHDPRPHGRLEPDRLRSLCQYAPRHDGGHVGHHRRRTFAGGDAVRRRVRKPHGVLEAHRPQRRTAPEARIALRPGGRPRRRLVLRGEPHAVDRRRGLEALPRNRGEGRLRRGLQGRLHQGARGGFGRRQGQGHRNAPPDAARRQPVPQLHGGGPEGDHRRSRHPSRMPKATSLTPYRGAMAFEAMRLHVDRSGKQPKAFMLTCGNLAMARARAQFSCNFFACAGIRVQDNTFFKSIEEGVKAALESKAEIVVVCASDDDYAEAAPKVKELLAGKAILVVAGAPACAPELEAQGITNFIYGEVERPGDSEVLP